MVTTEDILKKYGTQIENQMNQTSVKPKYSTEYGQFKQDLKKEGTLYERWAQALGTIIKLKISEKDVVKLEKQLAIAHVEVTPSQAVALATVAFISVFLVTLLGALSYFFLINTESFPLLFLILGLITSAFAFYYVYTLPQRLANAWRLKASAQMVPAILYIVVYMKHTSNLEKAIEFASQHLDYPLGLDLRKIFWDVEVGKFSSIKQSLDNYLAGWSDYAPEFIEAIHLIESSLFEPEEARRVQTLEKSLQVVLDGVYEKMLKYSREIRTPLTNVYMLGIILPTLGLALLPLASTLLAGAFAWYHVAILFNIIIPFFVFYMTSEVLLKRPGGYGETSVLELNPQYETFKRKTPWITGICIAIPFIILGTLPFLFQQTWFTASFGLKSDYTFAELNLPVFATSQAKIFDFKNGNGPFGVLGILLSMCIPLGIALMFATTYNKKTKKLIESRNETRILEKEFTTSLFQLGNRIGDGIPAEIAFAKVSATTQGQRTQQFFSIVNQNIQQLGMSLEEAIFNKTRGALVTYPSSLIATSMRILVESVRKGLAVAARSLMSISEYVKNMQRIDERLRDLLAEVVSDMKSNMNFLAPLLAGVVVGLSAMITSILNKLQVLSSSVTGAESLSGIGNINQILSLFQVDKMIPPYFTQLSIGIYIIQVTFILTTALVTVDSGKDPLREKNELAKNLKRGIFLYLGTALIATLALSLLSTVALGNIG
jgi:Flp pilus assembly protein TadB